MNRFRTSRGIWIILLTAAMLATAILESTAMAQTTWYVAVGGNGNGSSAASPFGTIEQAYVAAFSSTGAQTIDLAAGTYGPNSIGSYNGATGVLNLEAYGPPPTASSIAIQGIGAVTLNDAGATAPLNGVDGPRTSVAMLEAYNSTAPSGGITFQNINFNTTGVSSFLDLGNGGTFPATFTNDKITLGFSGGSTGWFYAEGAQIPGNEWTFNNSSIYLGRTGVDPAGYNVLGLGWQDYPGPNNDIFNGEGTSTIYDASGNPVSNLTNLYLADRHGTAVAPHEYNTYPFYYQDENDYWGDPSLGNFAVGFVVAGGSSAWILAGSSNYNNSSNWQSGTIPNGAGQTATFGSGVPTGSITSPSSIVVSNDLNPTLGALVFDNSAVGYTLNNGTVTLNNNGAGAAVNVNSGSHVIDSNLSLADALKSTTFTLAGGSALEVAGSINDSISVPGQAITLAGGGTLGLDGVNGYSGGTTVTSGTLNVGYISGAGSLGSGGLTINGSGSVVNAYNNLGIGSLAGTAGGLLYVAPSNILTVNQAGSTNFAGTLSLDAGSALVVNAAGNTLTVSGAPALGTGSSVTVDSGTLALTNSTPATVTGNASFTVAAAATLQLAGSGSALGSAVTVHNHGSLSSGGGLLVSGGNQSVGVVSGTGTTNGGATVYDGDTVVSNGANLTATQILQNTLTINAGSTVTIAPSGAGVQTEAATAPAASSSQVVAEPAIADGNSNNGPITAIQALIESGTISVAKGEQLENRIAAIERLAATDSNVDLTGLEDRVLASTWLAANSSMSSEIDSGLFDRTFDASATIGDGPAAVPEPSTALLAVLAAFIAAIGLKIAPSELKPKLF